MQKELKNYAFIDGQNLNLGIQRLGWKMDFKKFRIYLAEKYDVQQAFYFIGYNKKYINLYDGLKAAGYKLVFKPIVFDCHGSIKGNCDADLVLEAVISKDSYIKAVIVSSDGDFYSLVRYLRKINKLKGVIAPNKLKCSKLLKIEAGDKIDFLNNHQEKLEFKGVEYVRKNKSLSKTHASEGEARALIGGAPLRTEP